MTRYTAGKSSQCKPQRACKRAYITKIALVIAVSPGCMYVNRQYVTSQRPGLSSSNIPVPGSPIPVHIELDYRNNFRLRDRLTERIYRPKVVRALTATRVFVEADKSNKTQAGTLHVQIRRRHEPREFALAFGSSYLTGLTWGLFSTEANDAYEMSAKYTPPNGAECVTWTGTIDRRIVIGIRAFKNEGGAIPRSDLADTIANDLVVAFVHDFQSNGCVGTQIAASPVTPTPVHGSQSSPTNAYPPRIAKVASAEFPAPAPGQSRWSESRSADTTQRESSAWLR